MMKSAVMIKSKAGSMQNDITTRQIGIIVAIPGEIEYYHRKTNSSLPKKKQSSRTDGLPPHG